MLADMKLDKCINKFIKMAGQNCRLLLSDILFLITELRLKPTKVNIYILIFCCCLKKNAKEDILFNYLTKALTNEKK